MSDIFIPESAHPRVVIIGGGFAGLHLAQKLRNKDVQVVLLDKNNFHQFQPLFYQVATSGLEPDTIVFALRKIFRNQKNLVFRLANAEAINTALNILYTDIGDIEYDHLVVATGTTNNFYGMVDVEENAVGLKSIQDSLDIRSLVLENLERAAQSSDPKEREKHTNIVVVGGGPAGVEMAGALAEFKKFIFKKDYPDLSSDLLRIILIEAGAKLLPTMSEKSSKQTKRILQQLDVELKLNSAVTAYDGDVVELKGGDKINASSMIWTAGVSGQFPSGLGAAGKVKGERLQVDRYNRIEGYENIYAIGDVCSMKTNKFPLGHPQVAPVAIQQGVLLAKNICTQDKEDWKSFEYFDKGALATIGKRKAVLDAGRIHMSGFLGWFVWATVHLFSIAGFTNKLRIGLNWLSAYLSFDKRNRLIIRPYKKSKDKG